MKRKICFLLATVLLLFSFGACSDETDANDAYALYLAAKELYTAGYEATVDFKMTVEEKSAEGTFKIKAAGNDVSVKRNDSNDARVYVGGNVYRKGYILGDVYYEDTDDSPAKVMTAASKTEFEKECTNFFCINPYASSFPTVTEAALEEAEITEEDGRIAFAVKLSAEAVKDYLADASIADAEGVMMAAFDDIGDMTAMTLCLSVTYSEDDVKLFEITYTFSNRGAVPAVMKPDDASAYIEI